MTINNKDGANSNGFSASRLDALTRRMQAPEQRDHYQQLFRNLVYAALD